MRHNRELCNRLELDYTDGRPIFNPIKNKDKMREDIQIQMSLSPGEKMKYCQLRTFVATDDERN